MTKRVILTLGFLVLSVFAIPAKAWSYWYYQQLPYLPPMWSYPQPPYGYGQPFRFYPQYPRAPFQYRQTPAVSTSLAVEQRELRNGYCVVVHPGARGRQDLIVGIADHTLLIRTENAQSPATPGDTDRIQRFGWMSQWIALPEDADVRAMDMGFRNGVLEIFIPRR